MFSLVKKGVVNGTIKTGFVFGGKELSDFAAGNEMIQVMPFSVNNNPLEIAKNDNLISINTCLMVDLTGQICSESLGHRQYSGTGGQMDFVLGAWLSKGGKSFLCLPSTTTGKDNTLISNITLDLPSGAVVTTPRSFAMYVVTEYGIADLQNKPIRHRVNEMIKIAHPDFRDSLRQEAIKAGLIRE